MRALLTTMTIVFLTGCASVPTGDRVAVYDHKYNQTYFMAKQKTLSYPAKQPERDFVGAGATQSEKATPKPHWYVRADP
jgi:hypothetical protein